MNYLKELFGYNAKFADEVIRALKTVDSKKFIDQKVGAWGSLRDLMVHTIEAEDYWINKIIQGKEFTQYEFDDFNDYDDIEEKWKEIEADILIYLERLTPDELKKEIKVKWDKEYIFPIEKILQHIYTHTVHHRGQIVSGINLLGGKAPGVDII